MAVGVPIGASLHAASRGLLPALHQGCGAQCAKRAAAQQHYSARRPRRCNRPGATAFEAPTRQPVQRQPQTETGGAGGGGGWGRGKPPQGGSGGGDDWQGGGGGNGEDPDDFIGGPFERVTMGIRARVEADPWFFAKVAATGGLDLLCVLAVNAASRREQPMYRSEAFVSQVLVTVLNTAALAFAAEPYSRRVRAELFTSRHSGEFAAASQPQLVRPALAAGPLAATQRPVQQGLQLGLVGLLTGCLSSAAARLLVGRHSGTSTATQGCPQPASEALRPAPVALQLGCERAAFMAVSANVRHALLYAAEDRLAAGLAGPLALGAARVMLHVANCAAAAWQWRTVSDHVYAQA